MCQEYIYLAWCLNTKLNTLDTDEESEDVFIRLKIFPFSKYVTKYVNN